MSIKSIALATLYVAQNVLADSRAVVSRGAGFALGLVGLAVVYLIMAPASQNSGDVITAGFFSLVAMALFAARYKAAQLLLKKT